MPITPLPTSAASSGIQSVQDLYNLINGQTTTSSATTSQAGMNAMLKSALESSQGLAAVSSGQRAAGGYGSSTNTLLTNDLMARAAGSIAASNQTKTTTVGGVNKAGSVNVASMLGLAKGGLEAKGAWDKYMGTGTGDASVGTSMIAPPTDVGSSVSGLDFGSASDIGSTVSNTLDTATTGADVLSTAVDAAPSIVDAASTASDSGTLDALNSLFGFADGGAVTADDLLKKRLLASGQRDSIANDAMDSGGFGSGMSGAGGGGTGTSEGSMGVDGIGNVASSGAVASAASLGNINNIATKTITNALLNIAVPGLGALNSVSGMMGGPSVSVASLGTPSVTAGPIGVADTQEADMTQAAMNDTQDAMNEANNPTAATDTSTSLGDAGTSAGDGGGAGIGGDAGSVGGNGDSGGGSAAGDADGGSIEGPGTSISDSIPAKLSDGEFVFSADVVKAIGMDKLQAIQDKFHTPAATQRLMAFGKGVR